MRRKAVRGDSGPLDNVEVVIPAERLRTPSPAGPVAGAEVPPSTTRSLLGRFKDMFARG